MTDVKVTVTEITAADDPLDYGEGSRVCGWPVCGGKAVLGYHLAENPDTGQDEQAFIPYWEIRSEYRRGSDDVDHLCADCFGYLEQIAPAVAAFNTPPERQL